MALVTPSRHIIAARHMLRRTLATTTSTSPAVLSSLKKPKQEGDISSVFASLSGEQATTLPPRFSDLKKSIVSSTDPGRLVESWKDLLDALQIGIQEIKQHGTNIIPELPYATLKGQSTAWMEDVRKRGVVVIRDVVDDQVALDWKEQVREYVKLNPQVKGFPSDQKQVYELYWSKAQLQARSHPDMLQAQKSLLKLFHAKPSDPVSLDTPISYVDRLRIRQPGDAKFALGPHIDGGSLERWEDPIYRGCYEEILRGRWRDHDAYDIGRRLGANSDLYGGPGQCGVLRPWQGWLSLSNTGPSEGTLRTFPLIKESTAYVILRPFFKPTLPPTSPRFLAAENWKLDLDSTDFPGSAMGRGQELTHITHPHLSLESGGVVSMKPVKPGDMVFWHCDGIHAVESIHKGTGDSSVFYIPSVPMTLQNIEYVLAERESFLTAGGTPPPDFPGGAGENGFVGMGQVSDIMSEDGMRAMGLKKFTPWKGASEGEMKLIDDANRVLGL